MRACSKIIYALSVSATALVMYSADSTAETASQSVIAGRLDGSGDICLRLCTSEEEPTPDTPKPSQTPVIVPEHDLADKVPRRGATTTAPATRWEECMLTGNGRMGAMVFGRP